MRGSQKPHVLLLVPLLMAAVLITLTIPVTCVMAMPMQAGGCDAPVPTTGHAGMPMGGSTRPAPAQGGNQLCSHVTAATTALSPENLRLLGAIALLAAAVLAVVSMPVPTAARLARVVIEPSPPPGLVLTAAQLRV